MQTQTQEEWERETIVSTIRSYDNLENFTASVVGRALNYALDGAADFSELEAVEKSIVGIKVEKYWLRHTGLPMKKTKEKIARLLKEDPSTPITNTLLDTEIEHIPVDVKHTIGDNWMVPPEAFGHWLLLFKTNLKQNKCSMGLFKANEDRLTVGCNQDKKKNIRAEAKSEIVWLVTDYPIPAAV